MSLVLSQREYDALMHVVRKALIDGSALVRAQKIAGLTAHSPPIFIVRCDETEGRLLLAAAERERPADVRALRAALDEAGRPLGSGSPDGRGAADRAER